MIQVKRFSNQKHLMILLLLADVVDWLLLTLNRIFFNKANLGQTLNSRTRTLLVSSLHVIWCKSVRLRHNRDWIRACCLVSRRNICSLRSFFDWLVATQRRSITLLYKHRIHSLKKFYPGPAETTKFVDDADMKFLYFPSVPIIFPPMQKCFPSVVSKRVYPVSLRMHNKSVQRKPAKL